MNKELICVYQDCPLCGRKGRKLGKLFTEKKLNVRKVGFATDEGRDLCFKAIQNRICKMPFFTDGTKFSNNINDFIETKTWQNRAKKLGKTARKSTRKKVENGADS